MPSRRSSSGHRVSRSALIRNKFLPRILHDPPWSPDRATRGTSPLMRQLAVWLGLVVVVMGRSAVAAPPTDAFAYAVLATERVDLGGKGRVQGDVGCLSSTVSV